jgi:hypothetical protein
MLLVSGHYGIQITVKQRDRMMSENWRMSTMFTGIPAVSL